MTPDASALASSTSHPPFKNPLEHRTSFIFDEVSTCKANSFAADPSCGGEDDTLLQQAIDASLAQSMQDEDARLKDDEDLAKGLDLSQKQFASTQTKVSEEDDCQGLDFNMAVKQEQKINAKLPNFDTVSSPFQSSSLIPEVLLLRIQSASLT